MADDLIRKLLGKTPSSSKQRQDESQEQMFRRIIAETLASKQQPTQSEAAASPTSPDMIQNLLKVMNFQVDHAMAEKSELAVEKLKRLQAEKEAEELKRQLQDMKGKDNPDKKKVDGMEKKLQELELENSKSDDDDDLQKLVKLLASYKASETQNPNNWDPVKKDSGKEEPLPGWFPGSSKETGSVNHSSELPKEKVLHKDIFTSPSAPMYGPNFNQQNIPGNMGPFPGHHGHGQFPPNMQPPFVNMPPQYGNMNNFQRPQFPFGNDFSNMHNHPQFNQQFPQGQMPMNHGFNSQQGFQRPNFTQGPDQVKFTQNPQPNQQSKGNKKKNQPQQPSAPPPSAKQKGAPQQKNQPKQMNTEKPSNLPSEENNGEAPKKTRRKKKTSQPNDVNNLNQQQPQNIPNTDSVNLTQADIQNVKEAYTKKKNDEQGAKTAFKKKKNPKNNTGNAGDDDDGDSSDNNTTTGNVNAPKPQTRKAPQPQTPKAPPQNTAGAKKKETPASAPNPQLPKAVPIFPLPKAGGAKKKEVPPTDPSNVPGKENASKKKNKNKKANDLNLFVGDQFPTMEDVQSGKLELTKEVKDILMIAKVADDTITEKPKNVQDMILFHLKYPNAKLIVLR